MEEKKEMNCLEKRLYWINGRHLCHLGAPISVVHKTDKMLDEKMKAIVRIIGADADNVRHLETVGDYSADLTKWTNEQLMLFESFLRFIGFEWDIQ